ncbi:MAG TPA: phage major tail protein, TP901-1 family [Alphaproteobacteria bacterium]|jgi:TP901-1 family phage major tail protein|nr:phage major tail protein, TP901-1 family [Alphaproteobacteria bacterium]HAM46299.1 phage major tail protein, TP901-1 family [Alphaproteobacteria bacterium]HBA43987.1 phage major tail protein, TP901-1 family [Alphaproteobacteria bacterium]HBC52872.1 phage major tail protein, TP901-1 family [Alphaproteobacteria bacterium]HBF98930.1 phage major tail protein, TP901-1 family [Alphaproteobacteria bacterium]
MAAQKGRELLLKVDGTGAGAFSTVAGLRTRSLSLNARPVDITNADSANGWRETLAGAGVKSAAVSGSGVFLDAAADETARGYFFNGTIREWQIILPDFGTIEGLFQITGLEFNGDHDGEVSYSLSLESAGELTFTAV